jgi:hypothetical protein
VFDGSVTTPIESKELESWAWRIIIVVAMHIACVATCFIWALILRRTLRASQRIMQASKVLAIEPYWRMILSFRRIYLMRLNVLHGDVPTLSTRVATHSSASKVLEPWRINAIVLAQQACVAAVRVGPLEQYLYASKGIVQCRTHLGRDAYMVSFWRRNRAWWRIAGCRHDAVCVCRNAFCSVESTSEEAHLW